MCVLLFVNLVRDACFVSRFIAFFVIVSISRVRFSLFMCSVKFTCTFYNVELPCLPHLPVFMFQCNSIFALASFHFIFKFLVLFQPLPLEALEGVWREVWYGDRGADGGRCSVEGGVV